VLTTKTPSGILVLGVFFWSRVFPEPSIAALACAPDGRAVFSVAVAVMGDCSVVLGL
jgi:hypothetical protein